MSLESFETRPSTKHCFQSSCDSLEINGPNNFYLFIFLMKKNSF